MTAQRQDEHVLRALLDSPRNVNIFAVDHQYRYLAFNEAHRLEAMTMFQREPELGFNMLEYFGDNPVGVTAKVKYDRALAGEHFVSFDDYSQGEYVRAYESTFGPLRDKDGVIIGMTCYVLDVSERKRAEDEVKHAHARLEALVAERTASLAKSHELEESLAKRNEELAARNDENNELVERLRLAVDEMSTPVLEVWDEILALPVIGVVDSQRSVQMEERMLAAITQHRSRYVILDLTGVGTVDTNTADRFIKLARSSELLGATCVVTGIQPAVAQTLVTLGVEFTELTTARNLKQGLELCLTGRANGKRNLQDARKLRAPST